MLTTSMGQMTFAAELLADTAQKSVASYLAMATLLPGVSQKIKDVGCSQTLWAERLTNLDNAIRVDLCFRLMQGGPKRNVQAAFAAMDWPNLHGDQHLFLWDALGVWANETEDYRRIALLHAADKWIPCVRAILPQISPSHEPPLGCDRAVASKPDRGFRVYKLTGIASCMSCGTSAAAPESDVREDASGNRLCYVCRRRAQKRARAAQSASRVAKSPHLSEMRNITAIPKKTGL